MYPFAYNLYIVTGKCSFNLRSTNIFSSINLRRINLVQGILLSKPLCKRCCQRRKKFVFSRKQGYLIIGEKILRKWLEYSKFFERYKASVFRKYWLNNLKSTGIGFGEGIIMIFLSYITTWDKRKNMTERIWSSYKSCLRNQYHHKLPNLS